jgi:hypothetical protein
MLYLYATTVTKKDAVLPPSCVVAIKVAVPRYCAVITPFVIETIPVCPPEYIQKYVW